MPLPLIAAAGIGAGLGALNHLLSGGGKPQVTTESIGEGDKSYLQYGRDFALNQVGRGLPQLDPAMLAAMQGYGNYAQAGQLGLSAFTDPSVMARFLAFGQNQASPIFARQREQLENDYRTRMAGARAFGVRGNMMGPNYADINNSELNFNIQNMQNAQRIAEMMANYGQFGIAGQQNLGQYFTERPMNWAQQAVGLLQGAYGGPFERKTTSPNPNDKGSLVSSMLGGALTGLSFGKVPMTTPAVTPSVYSGASYFANPGGGPLDQSWRPGNPPNPWAANY